MDLNKEAKIRASMSLRIKLETYKGQHIGFLHTSKGIVRGWWEHKDGGEGGELRIDLIDASVCDYDGCYDLPKHVQDEILSLAINLEQV